MKSYVTNCLRVPEQANGKKYSLTLQMSNSSKFYNQVYEIKNEIKLNKQILKLTH